jgi:ACS family tartrate transporter-like MFS transporter
VVSAIGLIIAGLTIGSWWAMVGLSIATFGFYGSKGPFWAMPSIPSAISEAFSVPGMSV